MNGPDWAKILGYLHNHNGEIQSIAEFDEEDKDEPSNEEHEQELYRDLCDRIELSGTATDDIVETHKHLQNTGLVKFEQRPEYAALKLTTDGFKVAHERELSMRDNRINRSLVFFTVVLVIAQIVVALSLACIVVDSEGLEPGFGCRGIDVAETIRE